MVEHGLIKTYFRKEANVNYYTADLHFGHRRIIEFERKEFQTIEEHDRHIIDILKCLHETDNLIILGDLGTPPSDFYDLKVSIKLVRGNHDRDTRANYERKGIEVIETPIYLSKRILLSHEPVPVTDETLNVHGHLHNAIIDKPNYFNINIAMTDYRLVPEREILNRLHNIPKISHRFGEEWYAPLYKFIKNTESRDDIDENGHLVK